jgi:hypothetical protein
MSRAGDGKQQYGGGYCNEFRIHAYTFVGEISVADEDVMTMTSLIAGWARQCGMIWFDACR